MGMRDDVKFLAPLLTYWNMYTMITSDAGAVARARGKGIFGATKKFPCDDDDEISKEEKEISILMLSSLSSRNVYDEVRQGVQVRKICNDFKRY